MTQEAQVIKELKCECGSTVAIHGVVKGHTENLLPGSTCGEFRLATGQQDNSGKIVPFSEGT